MSLRTHITDLSKSNSLKVEDDGALNVYVVPRPPISINQFALPYTKYLSTSGGSSTYVDMRVDGSTNNVDFYIKSETFDFFINTISIVISDANATLSQFGNIGALANGIEFYYFNQENGQYVIESSLKTNFEFMRLANFEPAFGSGTSAFQSGNVVGTSEAYSPIIDLEDIFGLQYGLKIRANSTDKMGFIVKDNILGVDAFDIKVFGLRL